MGKNFYNLPAPWNPGYALPANVEEEGLRRATLVTGWDPRGTYYPAPPADNRYVIPGYIRGEEGKTARVTQWPPRGTYTGGSITAGVSARSAGSPIENYGKRAASHLVATVKRLPANQRGPALKVVLNKVDPTLWRRAGEHAKVLRARGHSAEKALEGGLAKAMSQGVLTELVQVGTRRKAPAARSQLGLGCYGCAAVLGDVLYDLGAVTVVDHRGTTPTSSGTRNPDGTTSRTTHPTGGEKLQFGPFLFGAQGQRITVHGASVLPPAWRTWFPAELKRLIGVNPGSQLAVPANIGLEALFPGAWKATDKVPVKFTNGTTPIFKGTNPVSGKPMGVFINVKPSSAGWTFEAWYRDVDLLREKSGWGKAWDAIKDVAAKVVHAVEEGAQAIGHVAGQALDTVKDLACKMVNDPATAGAAAMAAGPAAAVGVGVAQGVCAPAETAPVVDASVAPAPPGLFGIGIVPLAIGGGLLAFFLLK